MQQDTIQPPILSLKGRFNRITFLGWSALLVVHLVLLMITILLFMPFSIASIMKYMDSYLFQGLVYALNGLILAITSLFSVKRLHDFNASGWIALLTFVPVINILLFIFLIFMPGNEQQNHYGEPRETQTWETILAAILIFLFFIIFINFSSAILMLLSL